MQQWSLDCLSFLRLKASNSARKAFLVRAASMRVRHLAARARTSGSADTDSATTPDTSDGRSRMLQRALLLPSAGGALGAPE